MRDYAEYEIRAMAKMDKATQMMIERLNQIPGVNLFWLHDELIVDSPKEVKNQVVDVMVWFQQEALKELGVTSLPIKIDATHNGRDEWHWPTPDKPSGVR